MTMFYVFAALMIALALVILIVPMVGRRRGTEAEDAALNVALVRDRLAELKTEHQEGLISDEDFQTARRELETRVLRESRPEKREASALGPRWIAVAVLILVPLGAVGLYSRLGAPGLINVEKSGVRASAERGRQILQDRAVELRQQLTDHPDDVDGWAQLGRYYALLRRWQEARDAFARANSLAGEQRPDLMVDYAEMLVASSADKFGDQARRLLDRALKLQPDNEKGRWLLGLTRFQDGDYAGAEKIWSGLLADLPDDSRRARLLKSYLEQARTRAGGGNEDAAGQSSAAAGNGAITVDVAVTDTLRQHIKPGDTVFVFARAPSGPPMPIAAVRRPASKLPFEIRLSDANAMTGNRSLSDYKQVELVARVSKSGAPTAQPGDLEGSVKARPGSDAPVKLQIQRVVQ